MTPSQLGYRMPAEWEPHETTWIGWPHHRADWPGKFAPIPWVYAEIVRILSAHEDVAIVVADRAMKRRAADILDRAGANLDRVKFLKAETDRVWLRDSGPTFLVRAGEAKNSWLTGTAAWNFVAVSQYLLGVRPDYDGLVVDPQIGPDVPSYSVTRVARGATYEISVTNSGERGARGSLTVDGKPVEGNLVPYAPAGSTVINPLTVEGQIHGGVVQGIGQALMENTVYDDDGQLLTGSFMDYAMPRAHNSPAFVVENHPVPAKTNPLGTKGCGEAGCAGALTSVMNAVADALAEYGIRHIDMPASPPRVWAAIHDSQRTPV